MADADYLLQVKDLHKKFRVKSGLSKSYITAVDNVNMSIKRGQIFALIGESGSGKSTLAKTVLRLIEPESGKIIYDGNDITHVKMKPYRKKMQIIFQNPASSLNHLMTARQIIGEAIDIHKLADSKSEREDRINSLLDMTGINKKYAGRYIHEFSTGQAQRIAIAASLAVQPEFIICDEPTSALDVSVQSQIINLLLALKEESNLTYLYITHDIALASYLSDQTGVMYGGSIVETASSEELLSYAYHPYTSELINTYKSTGSNGCEKSLRPDTFSGKQYNKGRAYAHKCPYTSQICEIQKPQLTQISPAHYAACHIL